MGRCLNISFEAGRAEKNSEINENGIRLLRPLEEELGARIAGRAEGGKL